MNAQMKKRLNRLHRVKSMAYAFRRGVYSICDHPPTRTKVIVIGVLILIANYLKYAIWMVLDLGSSISYDTFSALVIIISIMIVLFSIYLFSSPFAIWKCNNQFQRVGFTNKVGEAPILRRIPTKPINHCTYLYEYHASGIPLQEWEDNKEKIELVMEMFVTDIRQGKSKDTVILEGVSYSFNNSFSFIRWSDDYISDTDFELVIGRSIAGLETARLDKTAHALIAGSTGSGKTVMIKCLMYQALRKGAIVHLVDFKGGANFSKAWKNILQIATDEDALNSLLDEIVGELNRRKDIFSSEDCEDLKAYNKSHSTQLQRILIVFDEVAECFDKSGLSSIEKKNIAEMEHKVATIARLGRAFGIHLILGLQRPDANVLTGQIKSNIDLRLCGRCDDTLSMIVLDNTDAAREIRNGDIGRFMSTDGRLIQGFYFEDKDIMKETTL